MNFMKAMSYLGSLMQVLNSINMYQQHKDESILASELANTLRDALRSNGVRIPLTDIEVQRLQDDITDIVDIFEGKLY